MREDEFSKHLGSTDSGKGLSGKGAADEADKGSQQKNKQQESAEISKIKEQSAHKDAQLSALAGHIKKAGVIPDFASVRKS